jgi:hypothetical protein
MADFDPQQPADKKPQGFNQNTDDSGSAGGATTPGGAESSQDWSDFGRTLPATTSRQWEFSHSCCDSGSTADCQEPEDCGAKSSHDGSRSESPTQSFFADWSAADTRSELTSSAAGAEAAAFVPRPTPSSQPETFWAELVRSQVSGAAGRESTDLARVSPETVVGAQSEKFWSDLVASQRPESADAATWSSASSRPAGMGWSDEEAAEWSPPERETEFPVDRDAEVLETPGDAVGADASARRDGLEWSVPETASEAWQAARSEGLGETKSLMAAAVEAAQPEAQAKVKKGRAAKSATEKKPAAKKTAAKKPAAAKAKKPAVKKAAAAKKPMAKKPTAKKVVKKVAPPPKITKAPTRRAA